MSVQDSNFAYLVRLFIKWKKAILITTSIAAIGSIAISIFLPNYYKSSSIFFPLNSKAYDPRLMSYGNDYELYGTGGDADRIVTIGNSSDIANYIIEKYHLIKRYDIDTTNRFHHITVTREFQSNYKIFENDKGAIEVIFFDKDADTAALIVNDIVNRIDQLNLQPTIDINRDQFDAYQSIMKEKYNGLDTLSKVLEKAKGAGEDSKNQILSLEMFNAFIEYKAAQTNISMLDRKVKTLYIIEKAYPIIKKAKPVRWLIVAGTTFGVFLLTLGSLVVIDFVNKVKLNA